MHKHRLAAASILLLLAAPFSATAVVISPTQDTDGDFLPDVQEDANGNNIVDSGETDPYNADTDGGGEGDGSERTANRNPFDQTDDMTFDADGDGLVNGAELLRNTDPKNVDTDDDGVNDFKDPFPLDSRYSLDENSNNLPDEWEAQTGLEKIDTPQLLTDDPDSDGLTNEAELARGTNPLQADTDHDGIDDQTELSEGTNPRENPCLAYDSLGHVFSDLSGHWGEVYVDSLKGVGIKPDGTRLVRGYTEEDTTVFLPDRAVTRYEFLKLVLLSTCTKLKSETEDIRPVFSDVRGKASVNERPDVGFRRQVVYTAAYYEIVEGDIKKLRDLRYPGSLFRR